MSDHFYSPNRDMRMRQQRRPHPADRDLRTYRIGTTMCAVGMALALFGLAFAVKLDRKAAFPNPKPVKFGQCYVMSDDVVVCPGMP